jgi:hypothetical protein
MQSPFARVPISPVYTCADTATRGAYNEMTRHKKTIWVTRHPRWPDLWYLTFKRHTTSIGCVSSFNREYIPLKPDQYELEFA